MGAIGDETAAPPYLLSTQTTLQLNPASAFGLDLAEFDAMIAAAQRHPHRSLSACRDCMAQLARAVALYRGDFLSGVGLRQEAGLEWLQVARDDLRRKKLWALRTLAAYYLKRQQFDECGVCMAGLLQLDALDEDALRLEMRLLTLQNQRPLALRRFHAFKRQLLAELDVAPSPETFRLAEAIRSGQPPHNLSEKRQRKDTLLTLQDFSAAALPNVLMPFVDRQAELAQITRLLSSRDHRLITLTGPGGVGKTRLAMRAAADDAPAWADGAWLVLLDDVSATRDLADMLIQALGIPVGDTLPRRFQIYNFLRDKELLLVVDNFERMVAQAEVVKSLLDHAPQVKVIAASRQRLGIRGEQVIEVRGLDFPRPNDFRLWSQAELASLPAQYGAVQLFVENARRLHPGFTLDGQNAEAVVRICQQLDGLPLGIELASSWVRVFPCREILDRIEQNVDFLKTRDCDVPARHASLRAVFEYSWELLSPEERHALKQATVFRDGFAPATIADMVGVDSRLLAMLRDKSMLQEVPGGRLGIHPLLHHYVAEKLSQNPD
ncbi:MAG: hypothetical protein HY784_16880 [Chloroflexi bacterium]|nr:hypothetical protein [Chloroflexota bacterium]